MVLPWRPLALVYRAAAALAIAWGIARVSGILAGRPELVQFLFFTVQSNVLCLAWMLVLVAVTIRDIVRRGARGWSTPSPRTGGLVMMAITVTMLVYLVVLVPEAFTQGTGYRPFTLTDNLVHIITPCLVIGDWLLFSPKGRFRWYDPPLWGLVPIAYLVFAFAWHAAGGTFGFAGDYPYPFMNVEVLGYGGVALWLLALTASLEAVGYVYVAADRVLGRARPARR